MRTPSLNALMESGAARTVRSRVAELLTGSHEPAIEATIRPIESVEVHLPIAIGDYVDFYSSLHHATNLGRILRPDSEPLLPNWRHLPVSYHGRSGTVVVSGTDVVRPEGLVPGDDGTPRLTPSRALDIELEVGFVVGSRGTRIAADEAGTHVFGVVLLNDWSARDIQAYEYQPLGPNLAKSFATTVSPWVVTLDALGAVPHTAAAAGSRPRPLLAGATSVGPRPPPRGLAERGAHLGHQLQGDVLDVCAAAGPYDSQRSHDSPGRPVRVGHRERADQG